MTSTPRDIIVETFDWRGILIEVRYEAQWLGGDATAHLELATLEPLRAPIPVTETGYRSHFVDRETIDEMGGPAAYVEAWLDNAAKGKAWIEAEAAARQYSLF